METHSTSFSGLKKRKTCLRIQFWTYINDNGFWWYKLSHSKSTFMVIEWALQILDTFFTISLLNKGQHLQIYYLTSDVLSLLLRLSHGLSHGLSHRFFYFLLTRISPESTSSNDKRLWPSRRSSNKSLAFRPAWKIQLISSQILQFLFYHAIRNIFKINSQH